MMKRTAKIKRQTAETRVAVALSLDGSGAGRIATTMPFLDHMLAMLAKHGLFDVTLSAKGDTEVDDHHTVEDIGIVLGDAFARAVDDKRGIRRFGSAAVPMDEALAEAVVDFSGRPHLAYSVPLGEKKRIKTFDLDLVEHFFEAFVTHAQVTLHIRSPYGRNPHHIMEAVFKAVGRALDQATQRDARVKGVPSTKGKL